MTELYAPPATTPAAASPGTTGTGAAPAADTIYDALRAAHRLQRGLCLRMVRLSARNPDARLAVFKALRIELAAHAAAEERFLYVPMLMKDAGLDASRHALSEHHEIDELVEELQALAPTGEAWHDKARELAHQVRHHLNEEESRFFQVSGKILTARQKHASAVRYQREHDRLVRKLSAA